MKFWIDIVNSPHVLFFKPIIDELEKRGHKISITAREYAQTIGLLDEFKLPYKKIGAHAGANLRRKIVDVFTRSRQLYAYSRGKKYDMALTFNSPSMVIASRLLNIPSMVFMDYEFQPLNHLTFRLCDQVVTPVHFPDVHLRRFNASAKTVKYRGLKEQVYISSCGSASHTCQSLGLDPAKVIALVRPPATMALYHHFENDLFYEIVNHLIATKENIQVIAFPRSKEQRATLHALFPDRLVMPEKPVDGRKILLLADMVISAGGTMNREAAIYGVPAYTVFKGKIGAVDHYLIDQGRIVEIKRRDDFDKIVIKKAERRTMLTNIGVLNDIVEIILNYVGSHQGCVRK